MSPGAGSDGAILTYHSLDDGGSVLSTPPRVFERQMRSLVEAGVRVVPLVELPRPRSRPAVAITFDDGFRSVRDHALPVLAALGLPATVFVVTDYCGRSNSWPGQTAGLGGHPLLGWSEVTEMAAGGIAFGSHSRTHPDLRRLDPAALEAEMTDSRRSLEDALGREVETFAYPYGLHDARVREVARAHFALACGTALGFVGSRSDPHDLERLDMYYFRGDARLGRLFSPAVRAYVGVRRGLRACRRWTAGVYGTMTA